MSDLEQQLAQQAPTSTNDTSMLFELPPLTVDGISTQLDKMTQVVTSLATTMWHPHYLIQTRVMLV